MTVKRHDDPKSWEVKAVGTWEVEGIVVRGHEVRGLGVKVRGGQRAQELRVAWVQMGGWGTQKVQGLRFRAHARECWGRAGL